MHGRRVLWSLVVALCAMSAIAAEQDRLPRDIETSFAWNQSEAEVKCSAVAATENARWTGQWRISVAGQSIYCQVVDLPADSPARSHGRVAQRVVQVEVGPIWNQSDAESKCPRAANETNGQWTGHWRTTKIGSMSVCDIAYQPEPLVRDVEAGPIWNEGDAQIKCPVAAYAVRGVWTGQWRTIDRGKMSVCAIAERNAMRD